MRAQAEAGGKLCRYAVGGMPYVRAKLVVNDPTLRRPMAKQMSATERSVVRSSAEARSNRRIIRYASKLATWLPSPRARLVATTKRRWR